VIYHVAHQRIEELGDGLRALVEAQVRTLAFLTGTEKISWLILDGTKDTPKVISVRLERIRLPADVEEGKGLCSLVQTVSLLIDAQHPKQISILQPGKSKFNNTSSTRIKTEAALQIAAAQKGVPVHLVSPITTTKYRKKLEESGKSLESTLNGGGPFSPREMGDVICAGVVRLPHE
jgi:hypothetical protein